MPVTPTYPGIYIEELPSNAHTIVAAPTSITVFIGQTHPFKTRQFSKPVLLFGFAGYEREFGGLFAVVREVSKYLRADLAFLDSSRHVRIDGHERVINDCHYFRVCLCFLLQPFRK